MISSTQTINGFTGCGYIPINPDHYISGIRQMKQKALHCKSGRNPVLCDND